MNLGTGHIPQLRMSLAMWQKIMAYTGLCPKEINGFGYIEYVGGCLHVREIFILKQEVTDVSADVTGDVLMRHIDTMMVQGTPTRLLRFQWHSHVNGAVYCSDVDKDNIEQLGDNTPWMVSLVVNKDGKWYAQLDVFNDIRLSLPIEMVIELPRAPQPLIEACAVEIAEFVTFRSPRLRRTTGGITGIPTSLPASKTVQEGEA